MFALREVVCAGRSAAMAWLSRSLRPSDGALIGNRVFLRRSELPIGASWRRGRRRSGKTEEHIAILRCGDGHHDDVDPDHADGTRARRAAAPAKVSMMIMRPPQHGHGCEGVCGSLLPSAASAVLALRLWNGEQLTCPGDVLGTLAAGEEAVVANAMEAAREHMDQEAADELAVGERHHLGPLTAVGAIVLPFECDRRPRRARSGGCWRCGDPRWV